MTAMTTAVVTDKFKVHVWVCGDYASAYEFNTREEARADIESRQPMLACHCYYETEEPDDDSN